MVFKQLYFKECKVGYWVGGYIGKPLIIFTHGATMDHELFCHQVKHFEKNYRVITWDLLSHGTSRPCHNFNIKNAAAALVQIVEKEGYNKAHLVGQSMGGVVSQEVIKLNPEMIQSLTLIGTGSLQNEYSKAQKYILKLALKVLKIYPYSRLVKIMAKFSTYTEQCYEYTYTTIRNYSHQEIANIIEALNQGLSYNEKVPINCPILFAYGKYDVIRLISFTTKWRIKNYNIMRKKIEGGAHNANYDNPEAFNLALEEFLQKVISA